MWSAGGWDAEPVPDAEVTMTRAFEGSTRSAADGTFEIPEKEHLRVFVTIGDDGCDYSVRAPGYCEWRQLSLCGKVHLDWNLYDVELVHDDGSCTSHKALSALVCTPEGARRNRDVVQPGNPCGPKTQSQ